MNVSIIIPAYNAAKTITKTLESLLNQTSADWEAIVIDDGSNDETVAMATNFAEKDHRIHLVRQTNMGVSAARNTGINQATYDWLLFLDADDWIAEKHLERMTNALKDDSNLDAVHCGYVCVSPDGTEWGESYAPDMSNFFPCAAEDCSFTINACLVRKELVRSVGGFDISFKTGEDWDLWQRIARTGARFGMVREVLAYYRMSEKSLSRDSEQMFKDLMRIITQGHAQDNRVKNACPENLKGMPPDNLSITKLHVSTLYVSTWMAGMLIGEKKDAQYLLNFLKEDRNPGLDPYLIAKSLFASALHSSCKSPKDWQFLWFEVENLIAGFLLALETHTQSTGLAQRTLKILESLILQHTPVIEPWTIGKTYAISLEVTQPIISIYPTSLAERLHCIVKMEGVEIGKLELPISDGVVSAWVIQDAIATKFAWSILGRFFVHTVYSNKLHKAKENSEGKADISIDSMHDQTGWTVFLQQLWGRPDWPADRFYDTRAEEKVSNLKISNTRLIVVEVSEELFNLEVALAELDVLFTIGGVALVRIPIPVKNKIVTAQTLRVALNTATAFELCRACVREALIGKPLHEATSLRSRLQQAVATQSKLPTWVDTPGTASIVSSGLVTANTLVLGRRFINSDTAYRRAVLPKASAQMVLEMTQYTGEKIAQLPVSHEQADGVVYAPEIISHSYKPNLAISFTQSNEKNKPLYGRAHFESLFSASPDPWKYTSPYEQTKYEQTLSLLPSMPINKALELACAEGHFTVQLAPHVDNLIAADISQVALERTAARCNHLKNVSFKHLDLVKDALPGRFNLIVCSEMLYYVGDLKALKAVAIKLANALEANGCLIMAHAHQVVDEPTKAGFDWGLPFGAKVIGDVFASLSNLNLIKEIHTPLYRVQLFQHQKGLRFPWQQVKPSLIKIPQQPTPVPPQIVSTVRWQGGKQASQVFRQPVFTDKLPILMYHRIAPSPSVPLARWCVTPEAFEEQLRYLHEAGYYSVKWEDWQNAMTTRRALPGRALAITFDDGYLDFFQFAWPLLKKYGFTATVFLVSEQVGKSNSWDKVYSEEIPLMGWKEIRQLAEDGVGFGAHSATHKPLTALTPAEIVYEGARSRTILEKNLRIPIHTFAYPYGDTNAVVEHLIGACGYSFGFSCKSGLSKFQDNQLSLPRIEVMGSDTLQKFVAKL